MKVGRNDPCPCGSGKKFKKCCGGVSGEGSLRVPHDELKFERINPSALCACGGGRSFGACHGAPMGRAPETPPPPEFVAEIPMHEGRTPDWLKRMVEAAIKHLFTPNESGIRFPQPRGESCATVAMHTQLLLKHYGVAARVVAGAARWQGYPFGYRWGGQDEYHMWVETEFGEVVDLTCDDLSSRTGMAHLLATIPAPRACWDLPSTLTDRGYVEMVGGHAQINVDVPGETAFDRIATLLLRFCERHAAEFRQRYPAN
jgi:hypothetical protein